MNSGVILFELSLAPATHVLVSVHVGVFSLIFETLIMIG